MKINPFYFVISLLLSALVAYGTQIYGQNNFKLLYTIFGTLGTLVYFTFFLAAQFNDVRTTINVKTGTSVFLLFNFIMLFYFASIDRTESAFVIFYSLVLLVYASIVYLISKQ
jgi:prepilin signal peptidase PulO-like enzyme (type II secretory pathway)